MTQSAKLHFYNSFILWILYCLWLLDSISDYKFNIIKVVLQ